MSEVKRRYSKEVFAERGDEIYSSQIEPHLKASDKGKFVAIDIETGEYELAGDELTVCQRLRSRIPQAQTWLVRVGYPYVFRLAAGLSHDGEGHSWPFRPLGPAFTPG